MVERIKTGIKGFDELIQGGIPKGHLVLVSGIPGTGKSIWCAQIAYYNALDGKKCLYLDLEQNHGRLETQMKQFGWDPKKVEKNFKIAAVDSTKPDLVAYVLEEIQKLEYDLIVLDSLDSISSVPAEPESGKLGLMKVAESIVPTMLDQPNIGRLQLKKIFTALGNANATALLPSESVANAPGLTRDTISEFLCDGIVLLQSEDLADETIRNLTIKKMRMTKIKGGTHSFEFSDKGIEIIKGAE